MEDFQRVFSFYSYEKTPLGIKIGPEVKNVESLQMDPEQKVIQKDHFSFQPR